MTRAEIQSALLRSLARVAPETDPTAIRPDVALRDQVDIDSMDFLNFVIELHSEVGIEVPEADYPKLATLDAAVDYVARRLAA